eukprot:EST46967.1 Hypothetical protein SS50377_12919 [Spironucleus salmonicida]
MKDNLILAMLNAEEFKQEQTVEVLIGSNKKFQLNYVSHQLPEGEGVLNWVLGE